MVLHQWRLEWEPTFTEPSGSGTCFSGISTRISKRRRINGASISTSWKERASGNEASDPETVADSPSLHRSALEQPAGLKGFTKGDSGEVEPGAFGGGFAPAAAWVVVAGNAAETGEGLGGEGAPGGGKTKRAISILLLQTWDLGNLIKQAQV